MEHLNPRTFNQKNRFQAPASLAVGLEKRLAEQTAYTAGHRPVADLLAALHSERWEIRCAALQALARRARETPPVEVFSALQDENAYVRMTALHILGNVPLQIAREPLLAALHDPDWQVRELALLILGKLEHGASDEIEKIAYHDPVSDVRTAANLVLSHYPPPFTDQEQSQLTRSVSTMAIKQQDVSTPAQPVQPTLKPKRWTRKVSLLAAAAIFLVLVLTAAGYVTGWWNPHFGDQSVYQNVSQKVTDQGITIQLTQAYADEGRTVLVYTITPSDPAQRAMVIVSDLTSSTPQKLDPLTATACDPQGNTYHCYWLQAAFLVPTATSTLTLTWDIEKISLFTPGSPATPTTISGHWHFVFTIAFHHEHNPNLPSPLHTRGTKYL